MRRLRRVPPINLQHDLFSPAHAIRYGSYGSRNPRSAVVLRELPCRKDARGDQQHSFATFVHPGKHTTRSFALCSPWNHASLRE